MKLEMNNSERLFLLKYVNKEYQKAIQKQSTTKKLIMLYELQYKLKAK